jgi:hypothetical protein
LFAFGCIAAHTLDKFLGRFAHVRFALSLFKHGACNVLCDITGPSLNGVKSHHSYWVGVLAADDIADDGLFVGFRSIGFGIGATKLLAVVIDYDVRSDIVRLLVWNQ